MSRTMRRRDERFAVFVMRNIGKMARSYACGSEQEFWRQFKEMARFWAGMSR